jgi:hypothetical protein
LPRQAGVSRGIVEQHFSVDGMADGYERVYAGLFSSHHSPLQGAIYH